MVYIFFTIILIIVLMRTKKPVSSPKSSILDSHFRAESILALIEKDQKLNNMVREIEGLKNQVYHLQDKKEVIENEIGQDVMSVFEKDVINIYPAEFITFLLRNKWQKVNRPDNSLIFIRNNYAFVFPGPFLEILSKAEKIAISSIISFLSMTLKRMKVYSETIIDNTSLDIEERAEQHAKMRDKIMDKVEWDDRAFEKFVNYLLDLYWERDVEGKNVPLNPNTIFHKYIKTEEGIVKKTVKIHMRNRRLDPDFLLKICEAEDRDLRDVIIDLRLLLDIITN